MMIPEKEDFIKLLKFIGKYLKRFIFFLFLCMGIDLRYEDHRDNIYFSVLLIAVASVFVLVSYGVGLIFNAINGYQGIPWGATTVAGGFILVPSCGIGYGLYRIGKYLKRKWDESGDMV